MRLVILPLLLPLAIVGCRKNPNAPAAAVATPEAPLAQGQSLAGKVLERIDTPEYSYLRLETANGEAWAAVPKAEVPTGSMVNVQVAMSNPNYTSPTLKRTFPMIYFGTLGPANAGMPAPAAGGEGGAHTKPAPAAPAAPIQVPKATGADARTIAEIYAVKGSLGGKTVTVRGQVVKFSAGIMNRNWVHLQDGTGAADKATHDLTVTTDAAVKVGDVITIRGTVRIDKDFGAGYTYPVIVEDGKLVP